MGKFIRQQTNDIFLFLPENRLSLFDANLHEMWKPILWEKKEEKDFKMASTEIFTQHA